MEWLQGVLFDPLTILAIGMVTVLGMIIVLRQNAFLALITAAIIVSLMAPGETATKISRVAESFGSFAGKIGIVIALAAIIGTCMMESGAADRVVRFFVRLLGEKRAPFALMGSGFVLSVPVFFDTVFYLLVPLARSLYKRTRGNFLLYVLAISAGGAVTHTLVPPTPGPLVMAEQLDIKIGTMIMVGAMVALPMALVGMIAAVQIDRLMPLPMRPLSGSEEEPASLEDHELPNLVISALPVVLPVVLISANTIMDTLRRGYPAAIEWLDGVGGSGFADQLYDITALLGNANTALLLSAAVAMFTLVTKRNLKLWQLGKTVETSLMSAGVIILITSAGGAFGEMLRVAEIGPAIQTMFGSEGKSTGLLLMLMGFLVAAVLKVAQGSSTVAMITASGMMAAIGVAPADLGYNTVYLATAIGSGSLVGSWMNDSGFWIVARMSGMTETEALRSWTILLIVMGTLGFLISILLSQVLPLMG